MRTFGFALFFSGVFGTLSACMGRTALLVDETVGGQATTSSAHTTSTAERAPITSTAHFTGPVSTTIATLASSSPSTRSTSSTSQSDAGSPAMFVVAQAERLYQFDPPSATFRLVGMLHCPTQVTGSIPFSMAVSSAGTAYVAFNDGELFRVSTVDASCEATPFTAAQNDVGIPFGMGFASNAPAPGETLYMAVLSASVEQLGELDTTAFTLSLIAPSPSLGGAMLTGTDSGELYAFFKAGTSDAVLVPVDKTTGLLGQVQTFYLPFYDNWAIAAWGTVFYMFTGNGSGTTLVNRYDPMAGTLTQVSAIGDVLVGAGVSGGAGQ